MSDASGDLLKKVYDKYIDSDYTYGVSNLNPKREISKISIVNPKDTEDAILARIRAKLDEIGSLADKLDSYKYPDTDDNNNFITDTGPSRSMSLSKQQSLINSGTGDAILFFPEVSLVGDDAKISPLENEIEELIIRITAYIDVGRPPSRQQSSDKDRGGPFPNSELADTLPYYIVNCSGTYDQDEDSGDGNSGNSGLNNGNGNQGGGSGDDNGDNSDGENGGDGDNQNDNNDGGDEDFDGGTPYNPQEDEDLANEDEAQLLNCAMMSLGLLQVILMLLKVVGMLKKILILVLNIVVPLIKIATRIAQCWINPPSAQEAIQLILEKLEGIAMQLIAMILQAIWDSLGLDCIMSMAQSILDQINAALAGVTSLYNGITSTISMVSKAAGQIVDAANEFKDATADGWERAKENYKQFGNEVKDKEAWKEMFSKSAFANPKDLLLNSVPGGMIASYSNLVNSTMQTINQAKNLANKFKNKSTGMSFAAMKAIAGLDDLKVK